MILIINIIVSYDQNISLIILWKFIPCQAVTSVLCLLFRPKTVHCSTKNACTSEITFLALVPCCNLTNFIILFGEQLVLMNNALVFFYFTQERWEFLKNHFKKIEIFFKIFRAGLSILKQNYNSAQKKKLENLE